MLQRRNGAVVFGSKQVFASHYFESSLGMALFIPVEGAAYGYVTYLNRSRMWTPCAASSRRSRASSPPPPRARDGLERMLIRCEAEAGDCPDEALPPGGRKERR